MRLTLTLLGYCVLVVEHDEPWDWHLDHHALADLLDRAHHGEPPGVLLTELWANSEHEQHG